MTGTFEDLRKDIENLKTHNRDFDEFKNLKSRSSTILDGLMEKIDAKVNSNYIYGINLKITNLDMITLEME